MVVLSYCTTLLVHVVNANSVWPGFTGTDISSGYSRCSWGDLWI